MVNPARIALLASEGIPNSRMREVVAASAVNVLTRRGRYEELGLSDLGDTHRSERPQQLDHAQIVPATLAPPPNKYGVTHWSSRLLPSHLKIGNATVTRAWRECRVQPWKSETFKFSTDPELVGKVTDVVAL